MLIEILQDQKFERDSYLSNTYIPRDSLKKAKKNLTNKLIKIITGPRRAGKSVFAIEILKDTNFGYVNFDDERLLNVDNDELIKTIHEVYGDINFLLFDEIQNLAKWELFVNRLHRLGYNIFLTGSNSKLLSSEMATHLTGRYVPINIYTFSFNEFLKANNIEISGHTIDDIWQRSGFKSRSSLFRILNEAGVDLNRGHTKSPLKKHSNSNRDDNEKD